MPAADMPLWSASSDGPLGEVLAERVRQDTKWGQQNHPDGTGPYVSFAMGPCYMIDAAENARARCQGNALGEDNWRDILLEEVFEALAEGDRDGLRRELIQVAAVAVAWVEAIDRRGPR